MCEGTFEPHLTRYQTVITAQILFSRVSMALFQLIEQTQNEKPLVKAAKIIITGDYPMENLKKL